MITELGGAVAVPIAVRKSDSTTTIRVNEVIMTRIDGAIDSTVSRAMSWIARSVTPPLPPPRLMLMSCACAGEASARAAIRGTRSSKTLRGTRGGLTKTTSDGRAARPSRLRGFQNWSWPARREPAALEARRASPEVRAAARAQLAGPWSRARRDGAGQLRDAAPSRRDSGPRLTAAEREAAAALLRARGSELAAPWALPSDVGRVASKVRCAAGAAAMVRRAAPRGARASAAARDGPPRGSWVRPQNLQADRRDARPGRASASVAAQDGASIRQRRNAPDAVAARAFVAR